MHIIGTAGHVDHGKSALVSALTGTNPDRWLEEQLRGMTLDLGFARLSYAGGVEAGIVDVPGHERFLHNMLAGAAGMELLLLVVDIAEGVMPQTLEHLRILEFLNVQREILVISKIDLVAPVQREERIAAIRSALGNSLVKNAPVAVVSTTSGEGIEALRELIRNELSGLLPRPANAPAFLPIDRVFALPGHGTIVTGTLMQGTLRSSEHLVLHPLGKRLRARALQVFGEAREDVAAGARVAVNLPGIAVAEIQRGDVLGDSHFAPAGVFGVRFTPLPEALALLRRRTPVRAYIGSAELLGTLVFEKIPIEVETAPATLFLRKPTVAYPHSPFVVRRMSPKTLLGGGTLLDTGAVLPAGPSDGTRALLATLATAGVEGMTLGAMAARANLREEFVQESLQQMIERGDVLALQRPPGYVAYETVVQLLAGVEGVLQERERAVPWALGTTSLALSRTLKLNEAMLVRALTPFVEEGRIALRGGYYSSAGFIPQLSAPQRAFFQTMIPTNGEGRFMPVPFAPVLAEVKASRVPGVLQAFDTLLARGALVKIGDALYSGKQIDAIRRRVDEFLTREGRMTMAQFRDLLETSRKYAVPLLEWFDTKGITVRSGDLRMLRAKKAS